MNALEQRILPGEGPALLVPVANPPPSSRKDRERTVEVLDGERVLFRFQVALPENGEARWAAAYDLRPLKPSGGPLRIRFHRKDEGEDAPEGFARIRLGSMDDAASSGTGAEPWRNQFHASPRRGWLNDPNGMVYAEGVWHLYFQYNPFGIHWGNMNWGHFTSTDLVHWREESLALFQTPELGMAFSGGGFLDPKNTSGLGAGLLWVACTRPQRGEFLQYSVDGGKTFQEPPWNPVVRHHGRDPKILWYEPEKKWVMAVFDFSPAEETRAVPARHPSGPPMAKDKENGYIAFYASTNLKDWERTGGFADPDRDATYECPEMFELPVEGRDGETRWILTAAAGSYFIGLFDGRVFRRESGPWGNRNQPYYAGQVFSDAPGARKIMVHWIRTHSYEAKDPDQCANQAFSLPQELSLRETAEGLRLIRRPAPETEALLGPVLTEGNDLSVTEANALLENARGSLVHVDIRFATTAAHGLKINGMDAGFEGRSARMFVDRTFIETFADDGLRYSVHLRAPAALDSTETRLLTGEDDRVEWLRVRPIHSVVGAEVSR